MGVAWTSVVDDILKVVEARRKKPRTKVNPKDGLTYVYIPPGKFMMGCSPDDDECWDDEKPAHPVEITLGFWLGQTPVTVGAYKRFSEATGRKMPAEPEYEGLALNPKWAQGNLPMVNVDWNDAVAYCGWVGGRLPTEAEWEYAARGGATGARYGDLDSIAWYGNNSGKAVLDTAKLRDDDLVADYYKLLRQNGNTFHPVGTKTSNPFGLHDTLGNVWEWVADWYGGTYYTASPSKGPGGPGTGTLRGLRGGSWYNFPGYVRASVRGRYQPAYRSSLIGFRRVGPGSVE